MKTPIKSARSLCFNNTELKAYDNATSSTDNNSLGNIVDIPVNKAILKVRKNQIHLGIWCNSSKQCHLSPVIMRFLQRTSYLFKKHVREVKLYAT